MSEKFGFKLRNGNGFQMQFENGLTLSVIWGCGSLTDNRHKHELVDKDNIVSNDCEIAIWNKESDFVTKEFIDVDDSVAGNISADKLADIIIKVKNWKGK